MDFFISNAMASDAAPQGGGLELLIMVGIFFAIMYFMIIRPQAKRAKEHKNLLDSLKKGDEVSTTGGLIGKVSSLSDNLVELKVAESTHIKVQKHAITAVMPKGTMKEGSE
ncbi:MAG TPA: preprotein translocase subunit YajC [Thiothrix sp.]|nr:preprotein translocase subunit YajC [Thiothrix sp.]